jgi:hypothetical protein
MDWLIVGLLFILRQRDAIAYISIDVKGNTVET